MTHPDSLTGADVFDMPDRSLSPTDPAQIVPWLRALPVDTILRDHLGAAWRLHERPGGHPSTRAWLATGDEYRYQLDDPTDMATMAAWRPFRIIWTSGDLASTDPTNRSAQPAPPQATDQAH